MSADYGDQFDFLEASVADVHAGIKDGRVTAEALVDRYVQRINTYDGELNAIITINSNADHRARQLDKQFKQAGFVGPLHGVPIILKDNQDTHDMPTTAGSIALEESTPERDAFIVKQLRNAGGIIIAKANLQELSYGVDTISSLGGATRNPYDLDRRPGGSSGGTAAAIAANFGILGTGSDTCSSVRSPPAFNNLVGIRPTRGLVSRTGIVPISDTQDIVGPITRTVEDSARMLDVMAGYDPKDPVTASGVGEIPAGGYVTALDEDGLDNARIGVVRQFFGVYYESNAAKADAQAVTVVLEDAIEDMKRAGASIIDPVEIVEKDRMREARVLHYEFARDLTEYLREIGEAIPYNSFAEVINTGDIELEIAKRILQSTKYDIETEGLDENLDYLKRLHSRQQLRETTLSRLAEYELDALLYPPSTIPPVEIPANQPFGEMNCELAAFTGLPAIVVPAGLTDDGLPVGLELLGRTFAEPRLIELAYAFEQITMHRQSPGQFGVIS